MPSKSLLMCICLCSSMIMMVLIKSSKMALAIKLEGLMMLLIYMCSKMNIKESGSGFPLITLLVMMVSESILILTLVTSSGRNSTFNASKNKSWF